MFCSFLSCCVVFCSVLFSCVLFCSVLFWRYNLHLIWTDFLRQVTKNTDENNYLKDRTVWKNCYDGNRRKNDNHNTIFQNEKCSSHQRPKNDNFDNKSQKVLVGPNFSGKICPMLKILSRISDRDIYLISKSPPSQNSNSGIYKLVRILGV